MTIDEILATEFSEDFVQKMRNRMVVSYHKYGKLADAYPQKVSALQCMQERIIKYMETGNTEWLIDAANFCMIESMHPRHQEAHFRATDSDESPGRARLDGKSADAPNVPEQYKYKTEGD